MPARKNAPYKPGELEVILSLAPTGKIFSILVYFLKDLRKQSKSSIVLRINTVPLENVLIFRKKSNSSKKSSWNSNRP